MPYKSLLFVLSALLIQMLNVNSSLAQCSRGGGYINQGAVCRTNPGYPIGQPYPGQVSLDGLLSTQLGNYDQYGVYVVHPITDQPVEVGKFANRLQAEQLRNQLNQRYWVIYQDAANNAAYREVRSSSQLDLVVRQIETTGNTINRVGRVISRVIPVNNAPLQDILGNANPQPIIPNPAEIGVTTPVIENLQEAIIPRTTPAVPETPTNPEPVDSNLESLTGLWSAVARLADGELRTMELKLDADGWAQLVVPTENGGRTTIQRRASVEDGNLKLRDGDLEVVLGQLTQVDEDQFIVSRDGGQITFVKR